MNSRPLPYQGSALPLSYRSAHERIRRRHGLAHCRPGRNWDEARALAEPGGFTHLSACGLRRSLWQPIIDSGGALTLSPRGRGLAPVRCIDAPHPPIAPPKPDACVGRRMKTDPRSASFGAPPPVNARKREKERAAQCPPPQAVVALRLSGLA